MSEFDSGKVILNKATITSGHTMTASGAAKIVTSATTSTSASVSPKFGTGMLECDGSAAYISTPDDAAWDITGSGADMTCDFWVNIDSAGSYDCMVCRRLDCDH